MTSNNNEAERIAALHKSAPKVIWLQVNPESERFDEGDAEQTWCSDKINETDVKYALADLPKEDCVMTIESLRQQLTACEKERDNAVAEYNMMLRAAEQDAADFRALRERVHELATDWQVTQEKLSASQHRCGLECTPAHRIRAGREVAGPVGPCRHEPVDVGGRDLRSPRVALAACVRAVEGPVVRDRRRDCQPAHQRGEQCRASRSAGRG
jgi:hypothetical protein